MTNMQHYPVNYSAQYIVEEGVIDNLFKIFSGYFRFSPREKMIMRWLLKFKWAGVHVIDSTVKAHIRQQLGISEFNFNNYVKTLRSKGALKYTETGKLTLASFFANLNFTSNDPFTIEVKFTLTYNPNVQAKERRV
jgi:hypothetical protein